MIVDVYSVVVNFQKPRNWALADLASLYWRVKGNAMRAYECIKSAYKFAPEDSKVSPQDWYIFTTL